MLKRLLGLDFEARAERWLVAQGLRPVTRNWHCRFGEIDLIMQDGDTLVFIEVRQRSGGAFGGAAASVTSAKQKKLLATARLYLASLPREPACRFDVLAWDGDAPPDWIRNAFDDAG